MPAVSLPDVSIDVFQKYMGSVRSERTAVKYAQAAQRFVQFCAQNHLAMANLPPGVLSMFSEWLVSLGLRPRSVAVLAAGARRYLEWCRGRGILMAQFSRPDLPKITTDPPNALSQNDLVQFLGLASQLNEPTRTAILMLPYCGLRTHELVRLRLGNVKRVDAPGSEGKSTPHICLVVKGKGGDTRVVPILHDGRALLISFLVGWRRTQPGEWLFPMPDGQPLSDRTIRFYVQGLRDQLSFKDKLTPHTLRRTYLTTLWESGVDIPTLTRVAGHRSVQTTMQHYLEVRDEHVAGAVGRSGATLVSAGPYAESVKSAHENIEAFLRTMHR